MIDGGDSSDFAGYFFKKNIVNNDVKFKIRDYIEDMPLVGENQGATLYYDLDITFLSDSTFKWRIDTTQNGIPPRLPYNVIFKK
ncbi:MAG: hypothetical protein JSU01_04335 [Bacteroidetes bacterium]|nr:hypothetical protein [Bacteroidota bacterium]